MHDSSSLSNESALRLALFMEHSPSLLSDEAIELGQNIVIGFVLLILIVLCIVGNLFVILAIALERDLRSRPQYYLIFSLAVADLLVGLIVTPLGAWATIQTWNLGVILCDFWISVDVLLCTASILHLVAIALDRYWSITDIYYVQNRTPKRVVLMLTVIWVVSIIISLAPIFGWKDAQFIARVQEAHVCLISQQISYQVFSTATAFYIPLIVIVILYYKIMRAAKKRFRRDRDRRTISRAILDNNTNNSRKNTEQSTHPITIPDSSRNNSINPTNGAIKSKVKFENPTTNSTSDDERTPMPLCDSPMVDSPQGGTFQFPKKSIILAVDGNSKSAINLIKKKSKSKKRIKESVETRRERKAWRTLAIITGTFVACWTPFFLLSLYRPLCGCKIPPLLESVTLWLGYLNSTLNPVIYTLFSVDFRLAFQRILKRACFMKKF